MVNLIEYDVAECENVKYIRICCRNCGQELSDFVHVKSFENVWEIDSNDMNWDANFKVQSSYIFCECCEKIGKVLRIGVYHLFKKTIKLVY